MLQTLKRSRSVREPDAEPPVGYHYEGSPAQMIGGKLTVRLRRNVEGSRNAIYSDLYYADTELNETQTVKSAKYCCCISGCSKTIVMYVKPNGFIVFENFFKHLTKEHPEYLFEGDLPAHPTVRANPENNTVTTPARALNRLFSSTDAKLREKLLHCTARVVAHGPYPLNMIQNPAVETYLMELGVTHEGFKYPSRTTVTRRTDDFLDMESAEQVAIFVKQDPRSRLDSHLLLHLTVKM